MSPDGWNEYEKLVLSKLESLEKGQEETRKQIGTLQVEVGKLQVKAGIIGAIAGAIPAGFIAFIKHWKDS